MRGWIYVFTNKAMPGLIKIGQTERDPNLRVSEQHSGLPYPHDIQYEVMVKNPYATEQRIHRSLKKYHESKEWFRMDVETAVAQIQLLISDNHYTETYYLVEEKKIAELKAKELEKRELAAKERFEYNKRQSQIEVEEKKITQEYDLRLANYTVIEEKITPLAILLLISLPFAFFGGIILMEESVVLGLLCWSPYIYVAYTNNSDSHKEQKRRSDPGYLKLLKERDQAIESMKQRLKNAKIENSEPSSLDLNKNDQLNALQKSIVEINNTNSQSNTHSHPVLEELKQIELKNFNGVGKLREIKHLDLSRQSLKSLPSSITHLDHITSLDISQNCFTEIPDVIRKLHNLEFININENKLKVLPEWICELKRLKGLSIDYNNISTIPNSMAKLPNLESMHLVGNELTVLPECIFRFKKLKTLEVSENPIATLSSKISQLRGLKEFFAADCKLRNIPKSIGSLNNLHTLVLSRNQITDIPDSLSKLLNITLLHLDGNLITKLPSWLNKLEKIEEIAFNDNNITSIPDYVFQMDNLKALLIDGNDINQEHLYVYQEILGLNAAMEYDGDDADALEYNR